MTYQNILFTIEQGIATLTLYQELADDPFPHIAH